MRYTKKLKGKLATEYLKSLYPKAICSLNADNPFELLIATRLSAQCTDARVNIVTPALFGKYPTPLALSQADTKDVEEIIKSCGLYKTKAKSIINCAKALLERFNGEVPDNIEDLTSLPGIGRKTANLICGDVYGKPAIVADTHLLRITKRLGFIDTTDPYKAEMALIRIIDPAESNNFCHRLVLFGRDVCRARSPKCDECGMTDFCRHFKKG